LSSPPSHPGMVDTQGHVMADVIRRSHEERLQAGGTEIDKDNVSQTGAGGETQIAPRTDTGTQTTNIPTKTQEGEGGEGGEGTKKKKKKKRDRRHKYRGKKSHLMISLICCILATVCLILPVVDFVAMAVEINK
ncbi:hypothetical protein PMAYCL1PPCAC_13522, partial [Pristionchus mayeri]